MPTAKEVQIELCRREWAEWIAECESSNMSVREWCAANGVNVNTYYGRVAALKKDKIADLRRAALNYIQLNPDFALVYPETYGGENVSTPVERLKGDANCDGQVDLSDAVMIMQALANPNKYGINGTAEHHLTEQGKFNGDMDGDGLTVGDALAIQRKLLGLDNDEITDCNSVPRYEVYPLSRYRSPYLLR